MASAKKSKKRVVIFVIAGALLIILTLLVILGSKKETIYTVQTEKITRRTITQTVTATGKIQPELQVVITPEVSGEVVELLVKQGMSVKKGQELMKIKPDIYIAMRDNAQAGVASSKASADRADSEMNRSNELFKKGLVSVSDCELAKTNYEVAKAQYDQAVAGLNQAAESLRKTTIYSPMDGIVSDRPVELGDRVLGTSEFQGTTVMTVADLTRMEARVDVSENDVVNVHMQDSAKITVDAFPDRTFMGTVYEIANTATTTGAGTQEEVTNFQVKIRIPNAEGLLKPGMSMTATIQTQTKENVLSVPIQSVTVRELDKNKNKMQDNSSSPDDNGQNDNRIKQKTDKPREVIFIVDNNVVKAVEVKRGIADDQYVELASAGDLKEGKEVVSGSYKSINRELEDGVKVKVDNAKKTTTTSTNK
jgi:HlyD family secretion protein